MPNEFWCECPDPAGKGLEHCGRCGLVTAPTPEQDRETALALARVVLGARRKR